MRAGLGPGRVGGWWIVTGDLRERLAEALREADAWAQLQLPEDRERFAAAVLTVFEAEAVELRERAEEAEALVAKVKRLHERRAPNGTGPDACDAGTDAGGRD